MGVWPDSERWDAAYCGWTMAETYAVVWSVGGGQARLGRLELSADGFALVGDDQAPLAVGAADVTAVRVGETAGERLRDLKTVLVERSAEPSLRIAAVNGAGELWEIAEVLSGLGPHKRGFQSLLVRVPIRPDRVGDVQELILRGPPFDPHQIAGLRRHEVFLESHEVVFLFQGWDVRRSVEQLARSPQIWAAAVDWRRYIAGRPIILDSAYLWTADASD